MSDQINVDYKVLEFLQSDLSATIPLFSGVMYDYQQKMAQARNEIEAQYGEAMREEQCAENEKQDMIVLVNYAKDELYYANCNLTEAENDLSYAQEELHQAETFADNLCGEDSDSYASTQSRASVERALSKVEQCEKRVQECQDHVQRCDDLLTDRESKLTLVEEKLRQAIAWKEHVEQEGDIFNEKAIEYVNAVEEYMERYSRGVSQCCEKLESYADFLKNSQEYLSCDYDSMSPPDLPHEAGSDLFGLYRRMHGYSK